MSAITDILGQLPLGDLAKQVGASQEETKQASTQVITSLLGGLTAHSQDSSGEQSLASALVSHVTQGKGFAADGVQLDRVDTTDGAKIVQHALGADTTKTAAALAEKTGSDQSLLQKLLPMLAPVVMGYVATQAMGGKSDSTNQSGSVASMLGGLLSGGSSGGVTGMLGGLLSGSQSASSGGLSSMLGGLLGGALGGKKEKTATQQGTSGGLSGLLDAIF